MESSSEESDAYIPGLSKPGNMRHRVKGRRTPEVKANISVDRPVEEDLPLTKDILVHDLSQSLDAHTQRRHSRKASFKDLRIEDKKRVANLIKELAKAGDEKEKVVTQLHEERQQYERQILDLVSQQEAVLKEREETQLQLFETQQLLKQYQEQVILEEKEKRRRQQSPRDNQKGNDSVRFSPRAWNAEVFGQKNEENLQFRPSALPEDINQHERISNRPASEFCVEAETLNVHNNEAHQYFGGRPYTTQIDREIAQERCHLEPGQKKGEAHSRRHHGAKLRSEKGLGPLREPIMSSTQKSSQIIEEISFNSLPTIASENFEPLPLDTSPRTTLGFSGQNCFHDNRKTGDQIRNRVGFAEKVEDLDSARIHSPVLEGGAKALGDQQFIDYYKKLTPSERKHELLRQRSALLDEQNRLKKILTDQEKQLQEKQEMLNRRHKQRLEECEEVRLNSGNMEKRGKDTFERRDTVKISIVEKAGIEEVAKKLNLSDISSHSNTASDSSTRQGVSRQLKSAGTSPMNFHTRTSVGTSPVRPEPLEPEKFDLPDLVDAGTSVSYAHIVRSPQQSNLPLHVNRQRTSPSHKGLPSPGDKTLAILEIVNSLDRLSDSLNSSIHSQEGSITRIMSSRSHSTNTSALDRDNPVEDLEESRILEEVFFLK